MSEAAPPKKGLLSVWTLAIGHFVVDLNTGSIAALLPIIQAPFHLSLGALSAVLATANVMSSIIQPLFGYLGDRRRRPWVLALGIALASFGTAVVGHLGSYDLILVAVAISGVGAAMYHPEATRGAYLVASQKRASAMSVFAAGGNIGFAFGPLLMAGALSVFGLPGTTAFAIPGIVAMVFFLGTFSRQASVPPPPRSQVGHRRPDLGAVTLLVLVVIIRSSVLFSVATFAPLFLEKTFHLSPHLAGALDFVFLIFGALGSIAGGPVADRFGHRFQLLMAQGLAIPVLFLMPHLPLPAFLAFMAVAGFLTVSTFPTTVTLTQELLPRNIGVAGGLAAGFGVGAGSAVVFVLGHLGDRVGLAPLMGALFLLPVIGCLFALPLTPKRLHAALEG